MTVEAAGKLWEPNEIGWTTTFATKAPTTGAISIHPKIQIRVDGAQEGTDRTESLPPPSAEQIAAAEYFFQHESAIYDEILQQMLRFCQQRFAEDSVFFDELADVDSIESLESLMGIFEVSIEPGAVDGFAWIALTGNCDWEVEHGTGICLWKDIVLDIGTHDTVMEGPMSEYQMLPPLEHAEREATRQHVIQQLEAAANAHAESVQAEYLAQMPDPVRLAMAIASRDEALTEELVERGVRLDNFPGGYGSPLFSAIHRCDAKAIEQMLELGFPVNRRAVKEAREMLQGMRLSQQLQQQMLGDLTSMASGQGPQPGGPMSLLGDFQAAAADALAQLGSEVPIPPTQDAQHLEDEQQRMQQNAQQAADAVSQLEKIVKLLEGAR